MNKRENQYLEMYKKVLLIVEKIKELALKVNKALTEEEDVDISEILNERQKFITEFQTLERRLIEMQQNDNLAPVKEEEEFKLKIKDVLLEIRRIDGDSENILQSRKSEFLNELHKIDKWKKMKKGYENLYGHRSTFLDITE